MATVTVDINGRPYSVGCADGQEERVRQLARQFDESVRQVARDVGGVGDLRLFLMGALLLADEMSDMRAQLARMRHEFERSRGAGDEVAGATAKALISAAERIERLLAETA